MFTFLFSSLDGYHQDADHSMHWHRTDAEFDAWDLRQLEEIDAVVLGRVGYEDFASFWPTPAAAEQEPVRARIFNALPKYVVSHTLREAAWENTTIVRTAVDATLQALKQRPGKDIGIFGSARLTAHLIERGLLDELRVMLNPVLLGHGIPAFPVTALTALELLQSRPFGNGNILLTYRPLPR